MTLDSTKHFSAMASHYDKEAASYDSFNEARSAETNRVIEQILKKQGVRTVLDLTCGTGSQVFWLVERGYEVVGIDINSQMLEIAREKAKQKGVPVQFVEGDMRTSKVGQFDAVLTIFNAIGHLTCRDFEKAIGTIHANLKPHGIYIFDIFNLNYLLHEDNITKLTIDWLKKSGDITTREIQYSTITHDGILASYDIYHEQVGTDIPKISTAFQTLQVYGAQQLKDMLEKNGFVVLQQTDINGSEFREFESERILIVAKRTLS